jgi:hypothetical protein
MKSGQFMGSIAEKPIPGRRPGDARVMRGGNDVTRNVFELGARGRLPDDHDVERAISTASITWRAAATSRSAHFRVLPDSDWRRKNARSR